MDHTTTGARTMFQCDENKPPTSTKQPFFKGTASRFLFRSAPPLVTTTKPTSSNGVMSLSKQVGLQIPKVQSEGVSSDADVPLSKLFIHNPKVHDGSASRPQPPTKATKKRKLSMRQFVPSPPWNPLDAVQTWKKFKSIRSPSNKQKIKQEFTSNSEDDPEGSSGAEVKGDSDYELHTDVAE